MQFVFIQEKIKKSSIFNFMRKFGSILTFLLLMQLAMQGQKRGDTINNITLSSAVRTIKLIPYTDSPTDILQAAVIKLGGSTVLQLSFDVLGDETDLYYYKIVNCNWDWTVSELPDLEMMKVYNEFIIDDFEISSNTNQNYTHYVCYLPQLITSGNFAVMVYKNGDVNDVAFYKRFMVVEEKAIVTMNVRPPTGVAFRNTHQQVDVTVNYNPLNVNNVEDFRLVIRQNYSWTHTKVFNHAQYINPGMHFLDYRYVDNRHLFPAYNEFRAFDSRPRLFNGRNINRLITTDPFYHLELYADKPANSRVYLKNYDNNGRYLNGTYQQGLNIKFNAIKESQISFSDIEGSDVEADYFLMEFRLKTPKQEEDIYIVGELSDWEIRPAYKMVYVEEKQEYRTKLFLKQGFYNYAYATKGEHNIPDFQKIEGSYSLTQNQYESFVYYRPIGGKTDRIVGYKLKNYDQNSTLNLNND